VEDEGRHPEPLEEREARVREGVRIYRGAPRRATAPPLVLLHGFTGHPHAWCELAPRWLERGHPLLAPALPGHDPGSQAPAGESFREAVGRLDAALREELGTRRAVLVGYSMGARAGIGLLARGAAWIERAVLIGGRLPPADPELREQRRVLEAEWCGQLREQGLEAFLERWERLPLWSTQARLPAERLEHQRRLRARHDPEGLARAIECLGLAAMPRETEPLASVKARVTLVVGSRDEKFVPLTRELRDALGGALARTVPGAGHNVLLEAPETVARLVEGDPR
jgi:2-succinyl-6-hydroxy-2,4-cyclohexadiene-1-carboxylate synthase